jgi:hypothetical protein
MTLLANGTFDRVPDEFQRLAQDYPAAVPAATPVPVDQLGPSLINACRAQRAATGFDTMSPYSSTYSARHIVSAANA